MAFQKLPDNIGMMYIPDAKTKPQRHNCSDCFSCQWCGKERCRTCRSTCCHEVKNTHNTTNGMKGENGEEEGGNK